jgi:hypothetical protein
MMCHRTQTRPQKILSGLVLPPASLLLIFYQILNAVTVRYILWFSSCRSALSLVTSLSTTESLSHVQDGYVTIKLFPINRSLTPDGVSRAIDVIRIILRRNIHPYSENDPSPIPLDCPSSLYDCGVLTLRYLEAVSSFQMIPVAITSFQPRSCDLYIKIYACYERLYLLRSTEA